MKTENFSFLALEQKIFLKFQIFCKVMSDSGDMRRLVVWFASFIIEVPFIPIFHVVIQRFQSLYNLC